VKPKTTDGSLIVSCFDSSDSSSLNFFVMFMFHLMFTSASYVNSKAFDLTALTICTDTENIDDYDIENIIQIKKQYEQRLKTK
jgi:hypothetical protein